MTEHAFIARDPKAEREQLARAVGAWSRIGNVLYFNRGNVRLALDADHCAACRSFDCGHIEAAQLERWLMARDGKAGSAS